MAAPVYDNSAQVYSAANVSSLTTASWTIAGADRYLVAGVCSGAGSPVDPTGCKWGGSGGTALTKQGTTLTVNANLRASSFTLVAPTAQTSTLYCNWPSTQDETALIGVSLTGVDQSTPLGTRVTATGTSLTPSVAATTAVDDLVVDIVWAGESLGGSPTLLVGLNQTSRQEIEGAALTYACMGMSTEVATGASTTMSWAVTDATTPDWGLIALPVKPTTGGGGGGSAVTFYGHPLGRGIAGGLGF